MKTLEVDSSTLKMWFNKGPDCLRCTARRGHQCYSQSDRIVPEHHGSLNSSHHLGNMWNLE